jgi:hypothetical protein
VCLVCAWGDWPASSCRPSPLVRRNAMMRADKERFSNICKRIGIHQTEQRLYYQWLQEEFK